jgi:MFS family permease
MANSVVSGELGVSKTAENLSTAMYLFGIGAGALVAGPVSETTGRNPVYLVSTFGYLLCVLGVALVEGFRGRVVCRFFVGVCASATLSVNGSSVRDQFRSVKRAFVFPVVAWANVAGEYVHTLAYSGWVWGWVLVVLASFRPCSVLLSPASFQGFDCY